ncbi:MAG: DegT/DnrJ/EryC1/StrS aminotransferase family protein [Cyclobacteriaceae bacterium]
MAEMIIPVYQPNISGNERKYVNECLDSTWISSKGKFIELFEYEFSKYIGCKYAITVSNGTVALHVALLAMGIGPGDEVLVPSLTYIASVNAIAYTGATPVFVDACPDSWQMNIEETEKKITKNTKAILAVHLYGDACNIGMLQSICSKNNLVLIEDCAEALGTRYDGKMVGTFGDIATFSFYGNKTITTGEGGMVVTNNPDIKDKCFKLKGQGLANNKEYWHDVIGFNYRMTNVCAALGLAQLERLDSILLRKKEIANYYFQELKQDKLQFPREIDKNTSSHWMCNVLVDNEGQRDKLRKYLAGFGIETRPVFYPIHTMPIYEKEDVKLPVSENLSLKGITLPSFPDLSKDQMDYIVKNIHNFLK